MPKIRLGEIAHARSGDKGASANIGVIAHTPQGFEFLRTALQAQHVQEFFKPLCVGNVTRYELPNLGALNFVLSEILDGGGSLSLRIDAQGKALGQSLLELQIDVPESLLPDVRPRRTRTVVAPAQPG
jgi:hypothetical protein